jgi:transposase-like protein
MSAGDRKMGGHGSKFGRKKEEAIAALLTQRNMEEAARAAGIGTQTLFRWLKIPEFQGAYREARRAVVSQSTARLQQASSAAVSTLLKIMVDAGAPASARVRAADHVLERAKQGIENEDLEVRLAALEQAAESAKPPGKD